MASVILDIFKVIYFKNNLIWPFQLLVPRLCSFLYLVYSIVTTCGVMVKVMECGIVVREFILQSRYYIHFQANTLGKGMNPLILPAMG